MSYGTSDTTAKPSDPDNRNDSNLGKWDHWYANLSRTESKPGFYGDPLTYLMAACFLADVDEVEDWGCGRGGFRTFYEGKYKGLDGSKTPFADEVVDLCNYRSTAKGILLRHVLEHNHDWARILESAIASFHEKLCIILFTPFAESTGEVAFQRPRAIDVPALSFRKQDIEKHFIGLNWRLIPDIKTQSVYGVEHVYLVWK